MPPTAFSGCTPISSAPYTSTRAQRASGWPPGTTKTPDFLAYGLSAPTFYACMRTFNDRIAHLSVDQVLALANQLYGTRIEEHAAAGTYVLSPSFATSNPYVSATFDRWLDQFRSWSTTDGFKPPGSGSASGEIPKTDPLLVVPMEQVRQSLEAPSECRSVCPEDRPIRQVHQKRSSPLQRLLCDSDDLVQKAVGWALEDNMRGNRWGFLRLCEAA